MSDLIDSHLTVTTKVHLAFFLPHLHMGGAERVTVALIKGLVARGSQVDLVLVNRGMGAYEEEIPRECRIVNLGARRALTSILALVRYLRSQSPEVLITAGVHFNIVVFLVNIFSFRFRPIFIVEHSVFPLPMRTLRERR